MGASDLLSFDLPTSSKAIIKVIGVGGGDSNAVNYMFKQGIEGVDFMVCNTDNQALMKSPVPLKVQLGMTITEGLGAGSKPEIGKQSAIESREDIVNLLSQGTKMVFITAGMGGGTGTGAAPEIAKVAQELDILTVGIVTLPFNHEGTKRIEQAYAGLAELENHVDALLVISNESIKEIFPDLPLLGAFNKADDVLTIAAKGIAEIITRPGLVNTDFADVNTVMRKSGVALMGSARASGENRDRDAIEAALECPLLNNNDIRGAKNVLVHLSAGSKPISMIEFSNIMNIITDRVGRNVEQVIHGVGVDEELGEDIQVTIVATGFGAMAINPNEGNRGQSNYAPNQNAPIQNQPNYGGNQYGNGYGNQGGNFRGNNSVGGNQGGQPNYNNAPQNDQQRRYDDLYGRSSMPNSGQAQAAPSARPRPNVANMDDPNYLEKLKDIPAFNMLNGNVPNNGAPENYGRSGISNGQFSNDLPFIHDNKD